MLCSLCGLSVRFLIGYCIGCFVLSCSLLCAIACNWVKCVSLWLNSVKFCIMKSFVSSVDIRSVLLFFFVHRDGFEFLGVRYTYVQLCFLLFLLDYYERTGEHCTRTELCRGLGVTYEYLIRPRSELRSMIENKLILKNTKFAESSSLIVTNLGRMMVEDIVKRFQSR